MTTIQDRLAEQVAVFIRRLDEVREAVTRRAVLQGGLEGLLWVEQQKPDGHDYTLMRGKRVVGRVTVRFHGFQVTIDVPDL